MQRPGFWGGTNILRREEVLPGQVAFFYSVPVDQDNGTHAGCCELHGYVRPDPAHTDQRDLSAAQQIAGSGPVLCASSKYRS